MKIIIVLFLVLFIFLSCTKENDAEKKHLNNTENNFVNTEIDSIAAEGIVNQVSIFEKLIKEMGEVSIYNKIIGIWNTEFPVSSGTNGYGFFANGFFVFCNYNDEINIQNNFDGSFGFWKVVDEKIFIKKLVDYYWNDGYIKAPFGITISDKDELIPRSVENPDWIFIGDLGSYKKENVDDYLYSLRLKGIRNSIVIDSGDIFYRIMNDKSISFILKYDYSGLSQSDIYEYFISVVIGRTSGTQK